MLYRKGAYKYVCEECNYETWFGPHERRRSAVLRCTGCGSIRINPSKRSRAKKDLTRHEMERQVRRERIAEKTNTGKKNYI